MNGAVFTHLHHRNRRYAKSAGQATVEEALSESDGCSAVSRGYNYSPIKAFEKAGYRKIGGRPRIDVGVRYGTLGGVLILQYLFQQLYRSPS